MKEPITTISTLFESAKINRDYGRVGWEEWDPCLILILKGDKRRML
jgi:hypothetical protein